MSTQTDGYEIQPDIDPSTAKYITPTVRATNHAKSLVTVTARDHTWTIDEPTEKGGTNEGPTPLEALLGSLVGCESVVLGLVAKAIGFQYSGLTIDCTGTADMRGARGVKGIRPYFTKVAVTINIATDEPQKRLELLRRNVEQRCPVMNLFEGADVEMDVTWNVSPA
ncbi:MAG: OsmC family protein [Pseudomonadota bacterium]